MTAAMARKKKVTALTPFYGYPAELVAKWCGVSVGTAEHYKAGRRKPPAPVLKLFLLHRDGKILDDAWQEYRCVKGEIWGPDGKSVKPSHVAMIGLLWHALAEADQERYFRLLDKVHSA